MDVLSQFNDQTKTGVQSWQESNLVKDIQTTKEEALSSTIAGLHYPEEPAPKYEAQDPTNPYDIQKEVLSDLSLLDSTLTPTDTYTNYYNQTNIVPPKYQANHDQLLFLDQVAQKEKEVEEGLLSEEQMLWDLYGQDLLEANGYNIRSVGWWQNKYYNNDFSSPLDNRYITDQITNLARQEYNTLLSKRYASTQKLNDSHLSTLLSKGDLSNEDIKSLFPELTKAIDDLDTSKDYDWFVTSNTINPNQRIHTTAGGERYYLHTDGQLYKLSNTESGSKIASFTENPDGTLSEISINGSSVLDGLQEFKAGALSIVTGFEKLIAGLAAGVYSIFDGDFVDNISSALSSVDSFNNDYFSWATSSNRVDMDGFQVDDAKDWAMFGCNLTGMLVGGWATGALASGIASKGAAIASTATSKWGQLGGKALELSGNLYAMSTGMYTGYTKGANVNAINLFGKTMTLGGWAPTVHHAKTVGVYMVKDFQNNIQQLNSQRMQYMIANPGEDLADNTKNILWASATNAAFNGLISMALAGGINDNQTERWLSVLTPKNTSKSLIRTTHLSGFLNKYKIGVNTMADFLDNAITIYSGNIMGWDKDADFGDMFINGMFTTDENGNKRFDGTNLFKSVIQGAVMTVPTLSGQLQRRDIGGENAQTIWKTVLDDLDTKEKNASSPEAKQAIRNVKAKLVEEFDKADPKQGLSQKIFTVLDETHAKLRNDANESIITEAISKVCDPKMVGIYKEMNEIAVESYNKYLEYQKSLDSVDRTKGIKARISKLVGSFFDSMFTQRDAALKNEKLEATKDLFAANLYAHFINATNSAHSTNVFERTAGLISLAAEDLDKVEDVAYNYNQYVKHHSKDQQTKADDAAKAMADSLGGDVDVQAVKDSTKYFTLKNEADDRDLLNSNKAAMIMLTKIMPDVAYKIDDNTFGILGSNNNMANLFRTSVSNKMLLSMYALNKGYVDSAVELYMSTVLGDDGVKNLVNADRATTKELAEDFLNTAIDNNVITKHDAAKFLLTLKEKTDVDSEINKALSKVFNTELTIKNVTKTDLKGLELYAVLYRAALHLQNPDEARFSGPTIAAEVLFNADSKEINDVIADIVKHGEVRKDFEQLFYNKLKDFSLEKAFSFATNRFFSDLVEVIGEAGVATFLREQNLENSSIKTVLEALVQNTDDSIIRDKVKDIISLGETLGGFEGITFKGNKLTLDYTSYMDESVAKFIKEVANTQPGSEVSRDNKETYEKPNEEKTKNFLETYTKFVDSGKTSVVIDLDDTDMDTVLKVYNIMHDANMFTDMAEKPPKSIEEFKTYINNYLNDLGKNFATNKKGTEFKTNLISKEDAKKIVDNLKVFDKDTKFARIREIDPSNKAIVTYDYYTLLANSIDIKHISEDMANQMRLTVDEEGNAGGIIINPFKLDTIKTKDGMEVRAFIKKETNTGGKSGRISSKKSPGYIGISTDAQAAEVSKDIAIKLMLNKMIDFMWELPQIDATIKTKDVEKLYNAGLVNRDDAFFKTVEMPGGEYSRLVFRKTKDAMKEYIETNKVINLYKILPFYSDTVIDDRLNFNTPQAKLLGEIPDIQNRGTTTYDNINGILNLVFEFDKSNNIKTELFRNFFAAKDSLDFNPLSKENIPLNIKNLINNVEEYKGLSETEAYIKYRQSSILREADDYLYEIVQNYKTLQESYIDNENNDDYKIWLQNPNVLKKMIKWSSDNVDVDTVVKETIKAYGESTYRATLAPYESISGLSGTNFVVGSSFGIPANISNVDTVVSKSLLDYDMGVQYDLVDSSGKPTIDGAYNQIASAYKYVQDLISRHDSIDNMLDVVSKPITKTFRVYEPSDIVKLQTILGASDGNIMIEDLDKLARLEADAYNEFFARLGFESGYGSKVYNKVLSLREQLMKFIGKSSDIVYSVSKTKKTQTANPVNARITEEFDAIPKGYGNLKAIRKYIGDYINSNKEDINVNVTPDKLIDVLGNEYKELTQSYLSKNISDNPFVKAYNDRVMETAIRQNADINGQTLVDDIDSTIVLTKRLNATENTKNSLDSILTNKGFKVDNEEISNNLINYSTDLMYRAHGVDYLSHWAKYSFLDPSTGKEFDMATIEKINTSTNYFDLLDVVTKHGNNLVGKMFIELDKHKIDSADGLSYRYKLIENEEDLIDLKTDLMFKVITENTYKADGHYKNAADLINSMTRKELELFLQKAARDSIGTVTKTRYALSLLDNTNINLGHKYLLQPQNYKNDLLKNFLADHYDNPVSARFDKDPQVRAMFNAINCGIDYNGLDDSHRKIVDDYYAHAFDKFKKDTDIDLGNNNSKLKELQNKFLLEELTPEDFQTLRNVYGITENSEVNDLIIAAERFILDNAKSPEVMSYLFNKRTSLNTMYDAYKKGMPDTYVLSNNSKVNIQDFSNFMKEGVKSNIRKVIFIDTEGSNMIKPSTGKTASSIDDLFQISFVIYTKDELGNLNKEIQTKFIKHDLDAAEWIKVHINYKDAFYKNNIEYQKAIDAYSKASEELMITKDQVRDILSGKYSEEPDFIVAYNGNNYEFEVLKEQIGNVKTLDAISTVLKGYSDTTQSLSQESVYKRTISTDHGEKHTAEQDTLDMIELIDKMIDMDVSLSEDRSRLVLNLKSLLNTEDDKLLRKVFAGVNKYFTEDEEFKKIGKHFNKYEPTLDNIRQLQRAYNYLSNDIDGRALFDILEKLNYESTYSQFVVRNKGKLDNALDIISIKMLDTNGDYDKAIRELTKVIFGKDITQQDNFENKNFDNFIKVLGDKDDTYLEKLGIDMDLKNNNTVIEYRNNLVKEFSKGLHGINKKTIAMINTDSTKAYAENFNNLSYITGAQSIIIDNKEHISDTVKNDLVNVLGSGIISLTEGLDVSELQSRLDTSISYNSKLIDSLVAQANNIIGESKGTGTFRGIYHMSVSLNPQENELLEIKYKDGKLDRTNQETLKNVQAGEIALTLRTIKEKLNITDLKELEASDGNLYVLSITNPADNMTPILPLRVRIVEGDTISAGFTPDTQELLRNRDFDGDHTLTSTLQGGMKDIAPLLYKYAFSPYNVHTKLSNYLAQATRDTKRTKGRVYSIRDNARIFEIGMTNKGVIEASKNIDNILRQYADEQKLPEVAKSQIQQEYQNMINSIRESEDYNKLMFSLGYTVSENKTEMSKDEKKFFDKVKNLLGVKETYLNSSNTLRYVNNPYMYNKTIDGKDTYTYIARKGSLARQMSEAVNTIDPRMGYFQKLLSALGIENKYINNPLLDLYTPNIYMTESLEDNIDNFVENKTNYNNYLRNLKTYLSSEITPDKFNESSIKDFESYLDTKFKDYEIAEEVSELSKEEYQRLAKNITMDTLWDLDFFIKNQADVISQFQDAIQKLSTDTTFKNSLDKTLELDAIIKKLNNEKLKVGSKYMPFNPYSDLLSQDVIMNKINGINEDETAFNYGGELFTKEDHLLRQLDNISNGFNKVDIFFTTNFSDSQQDTIGITKNSRAKALSVEILDNTKNTYTVKEGETYHRGNIIGKDENGNPISATKTIHIDKVTPTGIWIDSENSILGRKLAASGLAKGDTKYVSLSNVDDTSADIDLVCDINNAFKNFNKLPIGLETEMFDSLETKEFKINNKVYTGYVIRGVPFNIIGSDIKYKASVDTKDPSSIRRFELMTTNTAESLFGVGRFGSTILKTDNKGNIYMDFSEIQEAAQSNFKNHDVSYADVGTNIMYYRTEALVNELTEDEFLGIINAQDKGVHANNFKSKEDYLSNLRKSMFKINSQASYNEQLDMIYYLGPDRFYKLVDSCPLNTFIFGGIVNNQLRNLTNSSFTDLFYKDPRMPRSKNSSTTDYSGTEVKSIDADIINESQRDTRFANIHHNTLLHIPADVFYKGVTGRNIDTNAILRMHLNGSMSPRHHFKDSASIDTNWVAIDTKRGIKFDDVSGGAVTGDGHKTIIPGEQDIIVHKSTDSGKWSRGAELDDMLDVEDTPHSANFYNLLYSAFENSYPTTGYSWHDRLSYLLALGLDTTKSNLEKRGMLIGVDSIDINKLTPQMISDDKRMYYKAVINSSTVPLRDALKTINKNTVGYALREDLKTFSPDLEVNVEDVKRLKQAVKDATAVEKEKALYEKQREALYTKAAAMLNTPKAEYENSDLKFTWDTSDKQIEWKTNWLTRSGIDDRGAEQLSVDIGIKNYKAEIPYIIQNYSEPLNKLKKFTNIIGTKAFEQFAKYQWLNVSKEVDPTNFSTRLKLMGETEESFKSLKKDYDNFIVKYPEVVSTYKEHIDGLLELSKAASQITNEPFTNNFIFMMPFVSTNKEARYNDIKSTIKNMSSISKYDPTTPRNVIQQNMSYNFFEGSERIIKDLATTIASNNVSEALLGKYTGKALMDNTGIIDKAFEIINDTHAIDDMKPFVKFDSDITNQILDIVSMNTDIDIKSIKRISKNTQELLKNCFSFVNNKVTNLQEDLAEEFNKTLTLSETYRIARGDMSSSYNPDTVRKCEELYEAMYGEILIAQRIMESDKYASSKLNEYISSLYESGKVLVNKFGQKIERNGTVVPTDKASFGFLKENIELAMNSKTPNMFNQYVLEKALCGELYIMDKGLADQLETHVWTTKMPGRVKKVLQKASSLAASFQMALPTKMLSRLLRFTGTDYAMGVISNPEVAAYIPRAGIELSAALQSKGHNTSKTLEGYLKREGQPSLGNKSSQGVDPLDPEIKAAFFTDNLTRPLEFQNHLGRYAIYLAALDGFRKQEAGEGEAWYGSQYYNHEAIDKLKSPEDKAMYVMDFMLGSPGGFPALSKKTSGYLMYATFPMNLTRTGGAYLMSIGKLFSEGITAENKTQWYNNIVIPSAGMIGLSVLSNAIISLVCDYYDVDEDTEEEWKKEGVTLDPIGTLIGGTPSVVYDSINPAYQYKEMFVNPFTNEYNETIPEKAYGWMKANVLSRLNPMAKIPIELVTGKDIYGDSAEGFKNAQGLFETSSKYQYTNIENGMKKVFGMLVGSGIANGITDQIKMDSYNPEEPSLVSSLFKGLASGISNDLGNQKSWKKDTSNYYALITDMKRYSKASKEPTGNNYGSSYYYSIEDLTDADKLYYSRQYSNKYGVFDEQDYNRVNSMLKKMINNHVDSSTLYSYILKEFNENNVSEATLRSALNNNSIVRKLRTNSMSGYIKTLTESELTRLQKAIEYENKNYPILQMLFPNSTSSSSSSTKVPYYRWAGYSGGSGSPNFTPKTYTYYPKKYYPSQTYYNKNTNRYNVKRNRYDVNVSPQMGIWNQDYNLTPYETGITADNEVKWRRNKGYINRTN